ncbi:LysM peptidoglycan-binding domain-containing protein [Tropicibacter oceani]|uniref:LysM peptidoglycan-binding domain-containing protein n=1 Tax=Tropicibacter oceani TaxID=3058420 RepID=A0ABY8QHR8_9RHOB|nr:LysM peptidoglycan-binding domain-containing protein [Tropicibacter oceani]WGW04192.1 LysM peptidoglycan-binding domain-containing protein [Tropicibacter oceani]
MVLFAVGFVAITIGLVVFQPGANRGARDVALPEPVTRAEPALPEAEPTAAPDLVEIPQAVLLAPTPEPSAPRPAPRVTASLPAADLDDQSLRKMTWETLSNLNHATGREKAPGQPGSLLHTIVRRSLNEGPAQVAATAPAMPDVYVVQPGDSLVSIAETIYGDVNMTGPLFAANQGLLTRPDDLKAGQTLILPAN